MIGMQIQSINARLVVIFTHDFAQIDCFFFVFDFVEFCVVLHIILHA